MPHLGERWMVFEVVVVRVQTLVVVVGVPDFVECSELFLLLLLLVLLHAVS